MHFRYREHGKAELLTQSSALDMRTLWDSPPSEHGEAPFARVSEGWLGKTVFTLT